MWENFEQRSTLNGRIAHEIDRLENLIQLCLYVKQGHAISDRLSWARELAVSVETDAGKRILAIIRRYFGSVVGF